MMGRRIVSLLPSATEIVCALGCGDQLVGRSHECDWPAEVSSLPACTECQIQTSGGSLAIDRQVKDLLGEGISPYRVNVEQLRKLRPDLVVTQTQCDVCAVTGRDVEEALDGVFSLRPRIVSLAPSRLADLWDNILEVASVLDVPQRGRDLNKALKNRVAAIIERAVRAKRTPSVACIEWIEPLMAAGNWVPELVELAGGLNLFGEAGRHSPWLNWEAVLEHDPEFLIAMPCGFGLDRTGREMEALVRKPDWPRLRAVRSGSVFITDGNQFFNRPGPRLVESLEMLAEIIHPERFHFDHNGRGWRRFKSMGDSGAP